MIAAETSPLQDEMDALPDFYAGPDAASLASRAAADHARSLARSQVAYADATSLTEDWADIADWTQGAALPVSGGTVYGSNAASPSLAGVADVDGASRHRAVITHSPGGTARNTAVGFSELAPATARPADLSDVLSAGILDLGDGTARYIVYKGDGTYPEEGHMATNGSELGLSHFIDTTGPTDRIVTLTTDDGTGADGWLSAVITSLDGQWEAGFHTNRTTCQPQQVSIWSSDPRGTSGDAIGLIVGRGGLVTHPTRTNEVPRVFGEWVSEGRTRTSRSRPGSTLGCPLAHRVLPSRVRWHRAVHPRRGADQLRFARLPGDGERRPQGGVLRWRAD